MEYLIYGLTAIILGLGVIIAYKIYITRIDAREKHYEIHWVLKQLDRALEQLKSDQEAKVLAGLQTVSVLNDITTRIYALPKVSELTHSANPTIAKQAQETLERICPDENFPPRHLTTFSQKTTDGSSTYS